MVDVTYVLLPGSLVGTPAFCSSVILCCIYVAGLVEAGCFGYLRDCVLAQLLPDLDMWSAMFVIIIM